MYTKLQHSLSWLRVGYFGLNGPFRRYGRLPEGGGGGGGGKKKEMMEEKKMSKHPEQSLLQAQ